MKEIIFEKDRVKGVLRVIGKLIFFKVNNLKYSAQVISNLEGKGAKITHGRGWIQIDMFANNPNSIIAGKEINEETPEDEAEKFLYEYYFINYTKAGFKCK